MTHDSRRDRSLPTRKLGQCDVRGHAWPNMLERSQEAGKTRSAWRCRRRRLSRAKLMHHVQVSRIAARDRSLAVRLQILGVAEQMGPGSPIVIGMANWPQSARFGCLDSRRMGASRLMIETHIW